MPDHNPYWKLYPVASTPVDEICACDPAPPIVLCAKATPNPLACAFCNLEVRPARIDFDAALADQLAAWRDFHDSFYHLWLDSGEFESWALAQLTEPTSAVNTRGLALVQQLSAFHPCYLWWFTDVSRQPTPSVCPRCHGSLQMLFPEEEQMPGALHVCRSCLLAVAV